MSFRDPFVLITTIPGMTQNGSLIFIIMFSSHTPPGEKKINEIEKRNGVQLFNC